MPFVFREHPDCVLQVVPIQVKKKKKKGKTVHNVSCMLYI